MVLGPGSHCGAGRFAHRSPVGRKFIYLTQFLVSGVANSPWSMPGEYWGFSGTGLKTGASDAKRHRVISPDSNSAMPSSCRSKIMRICQRSSNNLSERGCSRDRTSVVTLESRSNQLGEKFISGPFRDSRAPDTSVQNMQRKTFYQHAPFVWDARSLRDNFRCCHLTVWEDHILVTPAQFHEMGEGMYNVLEPIENQRV